MNIVIPMAGHGARFSQAGWSVPKPLIEVDGQAMVLRAIAGLPKALAERWIFICLREHLEHQGLEKTLRAYAGDVPVEIIALSEITQGQACTVLTAKHLIESSVPLLIHNADTYFSSPLAETIIANRGKAGGIVTVFEDTDPRWSFVRIAESGQIIEVAEKRPISRWATVGMYYFEQGRDFVRLAERGIAENRRSGNEFYVGPLYNDLIAEGGIVIPDFATEVGCMGTPEDLAKFLEERHAKLASN